MRWQKRVAVALGLLAIWSGLAAWQYFEYRRDRELIDEVVHQQSHSVMNAVVGGIRSHRRFGPFFMAQLQKMLEELVKAEDVLAVAIVTGEGSREFSAGELELIDCSPTVEAGDYWDDCGFRLVEDFVLAPMDAGSPGGGPGRGRGPRWMEDETGGPFAEGGQFKAVLLLDRTRTDALAGHAARLHVIITATAGLVLALVALAWWASVRMVAARGRAQLLETEAKHLRELSQAAAGLAHETRNPLGLIRGWTQRVLLSDTLDSETGEHAQAVIEECDRVTARINQFLAFAKPQIPSVINVDLQQLVDELRTILQPDLEAQELVLSHHIPPHATTVRADPELLRQGLFNLLQNAIHFSPSGETVVVERVVGHNGSGRIQVLDRGPGVAEDSIDSLFAPYFTTRPDGTGLGLAIVQRIASVHGWLAGYRPRQDGGAVFFLDGVLS